MQSCRGPYPGKRTKKPPLLGGEGAQGLGARAAGAAGSFTYASELYLICDVCCLLHDTFLSRPFYSIARPAQCG